MAVSEEIMLKVENVSKIYKLGEIGGTTLRDELQRLGAKIRHKPDPTKKVGAKNYNKGEKFKALDNVSFEVKKGERIGIIGHNGAGKSTLLKLISRVTGPTSGNIFMNGRVASMLEVGTGFHPELTGRENVYMNGAILGMTKKEIDAKMEDIIEFSEVGQFIDTPVKRYSSGMYVKLAFSVAAHLDSEILIMDEVLAVGDMAFQNKCLNKMRNVSEQENRTILYVSHNMNTIRQLCERVIVLNHGTINYDGDVEGGINLYLTGHTQNNQKPCFYNLEKVGRPSSFHGSKLRILSFEFLNHDNAAFNQGEILEFEIKYRSLDYVPNQKMYFSLHSINGGNVGMANTDRGFGSMNAGEIKVARFKIDISNIAPGTYYFSIDFYGDDGLNNHISYDHPIKNIFFEIIGEKENSLHWKEQYWGNVYLNPIVCVQVEKSSSK